METVAFRRVLPVLAALLALPAAQSPLQPLVWVEDAFEDFRDGEFDASGADLYVTRAGSIKTTQRFDLNSDGYLDLVFNASHDEVRILPPTCLEIRSGTREATPCSLPAPGTSGALIADLNRDGFADAVLAPNNDGVTTRRYLSIFYGSEKGWSGRRRSGLIANDPRALGAADLDGDGWPEIVVLNGARWALEDGPEAVLRVYYGSPGGFSQERHRDIVIDRAVDMKTDDLDGDGRAEIVVVTHSPGEALVYWNDGKDLPASPQRIALGSPSAGRLALADADGDGRTDLVVAGGARELIGKDPTTGRALYRYYGVTRVLSTPGRKRAFRAPLLSKAPPSSDLGVADLDKDGRPDIVLADRTAASNSLHILWGDASRPGATLPMAWAAAIALADIDGDGAIDIAAGPARGPETYQAKSRVFFGDGRGAFREGLAVETSEVGAVAAFKEAGRTRLVFCNDRAGRFNEDVPVEVYWGARDGFSPERTTRYSIRSGYASSAADLNDDGYPDLVLLSIVHTASDNHPGLGFNILWGGPDGLKDDRRAVVPEYALWGLNIADVDKDGYLDLVGNCNRASPEGEPPRVVIWRGGPRGFERSRRISLRADGAEGQNVVADFDKDGYLDIAVARERAHKVTIFRGGADGFSEARQTSLPLVAANDIKTADLDRDGWLDLVVTSHKLPNSAFFDFGTVIFWGGPRGFQPWNSQRLPAHDGIGITIADFDADGHLDIYLPGYHYGFTRESVASHLFWGSAHGFTDDNRTDLMQDGGHGSMAADFNADGKLDLAVACHTRNGTHLTESLIFSNDGARFRRSLPQRLPTTGPHFMQRADVGNVYDRSWRQSYVSSVFHWDGERQGVSVKWKAEVPAGSRLEMWLRSAAVRGELGSRPWVLYNGGEMALAPLDRFLQYRAVFLSSNGDRYPVLERVEVSMQ